MSTNGDDDGLDVDAALSVAKESVTEIANLELALNNRGNLNTAELHLLDFGVSQGWKTCLEYLSNVGVIDINYS